VEDIKIYPFKVLEASVKAALAAVLASSDPVNKKRQGRLSPKIF
jgi:hypothetical protein